MAALHILFTITTLLMKPLVYFAAVIAAIVTVFGTRVVVPAAIVLFRSIEAGFAPADPQLAVATALPVAVTASVEEPVKSAPRRARRRKPSKALLEKVEALA